MTVLHLTLFPSFIPCQNTDGITCAPSLNDVNLTYVFIGYMRKKNERRNLLYTYGHTDLHV